MIQEEVTKEQNDITDSDQASTSIKLKKSIKSHYELKWQYWKQIFISKWHSFGDNSTAFFKSVKTRSSQNEIQFIKDKEGNWINLKKAKKQILRPLQKAFQC